MKSIIKYVPDDCGVGGDSDFHKVTNLRSGALKTKSQCFKLNLLKIHPGSIVMLNLNQFLKFKNNRRVDLRYIKL